MDRRFWRAAVPQISPRQHIPRPGLHELLDTATRHPVCLVIAAAGWGKTTSLSLWGARRQVAWLTLNASDADPARFARRLRATLTTSPSTAPTDLEDRRPRGAEQVGAGLLDPAWAWLDSQPDQDLFLVLDDIQELPPEGGSAGIVQDLCRQAGGRLHVVLTSRTEPPFSLERLRGQGLIAEIDALELAFSVEEVAVLGRISIGDDPPALARAVHEATGGWPAATCLILEMLERVGADHWAGFLENVSKPGGRLRPYLLEEVLDQEPQRVRDLLRRVAVLGEVTVPVARDLGFDEAGTVLPALARRGLVQPTYEDADSWALIPPLQDLFDVELALSPNDRSELHRTAAELYTARESHADALRHLVAAADHAAAVALLVEHGSTLVDAGQASAVIAAAELPENYLDDPTVQRVLGHAKQVCGQWSSAAECFRRASLDQEQLEAGLAWRMALIPYGRADFYDALAMYARGRLENEDTPDEAFLLAFKASAHRMIGEYDRSRAYAARAHAAAERSDEPSARSAAKLALAMVAGFDGDHLQMEAWTLEALEAAEIAGNTLQILRSRSLRALHLVELGLAQEAVAEADAALRLGERCGYTPACAAALVQRGRARTQLGSLEDGLDDLSTARRLFQNSGSRFVARSLCGIGDIHRRRGQLGHARAAYEEALAVAEESHDVLALSSSLTGLARALVTDDVDSALKLAGRAVVLGEGLRHVTALLTHGWITLASGDSEAAAEDAASAAAAARARGDRAGLAEALELTALSSPDPSRTAILLDEAAQIWQELGHPIREAEARLVAARLSASSTGAEVERSERALRDLGVSPLGGQAAGPLAIAAPRTPSISVHTLGAFQVLRSGNPIPNTVWKSRKARDLLKILVARRRPVPRELLMEILWPDQDPARTSNRLSVLLTTLRGVLASDVGRPTVAGSPLMSDSGVVWLDLDQLDVDAERFLAAAEAALDAHARNEPDALLKLIATEAQHTGDFLEEDPGQEWAAAMAEEVRASHVAVLRALERRLRAAGDYDNAARYALRLVELDRYDEDAHLDLVSILVDAHRFGEALSRYRVYQRHISELGIQPRPYPGPDESSMPDRPEPGVRSASGRAHRRMGERARRPTGP
jgi:ATP/maltotriose-dependent transcriptional regulator MalT/DNA-binding SARP family transcriptional activator